MFCISLAAIARLNDMQYLIKNELFLVTSVCFYIENYIIFI